METNRKFRTYIEDISQQVNETIHTAQQTKAQLSNIMQGIKRFSDDEEWKAKRRLPNPPGSQRQYEYNDKCLEMIKAIYAKANNARDGSLQRITKLHIPCTALMKYILSMNGDKSDYFKDKANSPSNTDPCSPVF